MKAGEGRAAVFVAVDHRSAERVGIHASRGADRFEALEPLRQRVRRRFGDSARAGGTHPRAELARDALLTAIRRRRPPEDPVHSPDRGVRYAGRPCRAILTRHGIVRSTSREGDRHGNATMGSPFGSPRRCRSTAPASRPGRRPVLGYVEAFHDRRRSALGSPTPVRAHERMAGAA